MENKYVVNGIINDEGYDVDGLVRSIQVSGGIQAYYGVTTGVIVGITCGCVVMVVVSVAVAVLVKKSRTNRAQLVSSEQMKSYVV